MPKNRSSRVRAKARTLAAELNLPYSAAHELVVGGNLPPGLQMLTDLSAAFVAAGWPVHVDHAAEAPYILAAGPAWVEIAPASLLPEHPPVEESAEELVVRFSPHGPVDQQVRETRPVRGQTAPALVAVFGEALRDARSRAIASAADDTACTVCGAAFPDFHLMRPRAFRRAIVCPSCVFDEALEERGPAQTPLLLAQLEMAPAGEGGLPAGWAAVAVLLALVADPDDLQQGQRRVHDQDWPIAAGQHGTDPLQRWTWLPDTPPPALAELAVGARLGAIVEAVDAAHPGLRDLAVDAYEQENADPDEPSGDDRRAAMTLLLEHLWPAVLAYAVSMPAQAIERAGHQHPLDTGIPFELLYQHAAAGLAGKLWHGAALLDSAIGTVASALGLWAPRPSQGDDPEDRDGEVIEVTADRVSNLIGQRPDLWWSCEDLAGVFCCDQAPIRDAIAELAAAGCVALDAAGRVRVVSGAVESALETFERALADAHRLADAYRDPINPAGPSRIVAEVTSDPTVGQLYPGAVQSGLTQMMQQVLNLTGPLTSETGPIDAVAAKITRVLGDGRAQRRVLEDMYVDLRCGDLQNAVRPPDTDEETALHLAAAMVAAVGEREG